MAKTKRPPKTRKKLGGPRVGEGGPRAVKVEAVQEFQDRLSGGGTVLLTEYRGMTVTELAELRTSLRDAGADYRVYKNTLAAIAARNLGYDDLVEHLTGPTAFTFPSGDPVVAAKKLSEFAKRAPALVIKGGLLEGKVLGSDGVSALASLDSREVMLAKAAGMFMTPVQQLANAFAAAFNQVGSLLVQLRDKLPAESSAAQTDASAATAGDAVADGSSGEAPETTGETAETVSDEEPAPETTEAPAADDAPAAEAATDNATTDETPEA